MEEKNVTIRGMSRNGDDTKVVPLEKAMEIVNKALSQGNLVIATKKGKPSVTLKPSMPKATMEEHLKESKEVIKTPPVKGG